MQKAQVLIVLLSVLTNFHSAAAHAAAIGSFKSVLGASPSVRVDNPTAQARQASTGDPVFAADKITTNPGQTARIVLADQSELTLAPSSVVSIEAFETQMTSQRTLLHLFYGMLRALVRRAYVGEDLFAVKTPNAAMGVRGTHFIVSSSRSSGATELHTLHGTVAMGSSLDALKSTSTTTLVKAGYSSSMSKGSTSASTPQHFDNAQYHETLKKMSPDFEKTVGTDNSSTSTSTSTNGHTKSLSDALQQQHQNGDSQGSDSRGLRGDSGSLSGTQNGMRGGSSGGAGSGGGGNGGGPGGSSNAGGSPGGSGAQSGGSSPDTSQGSSTNGSQGSNPGGSPSSSPGSTPSSTQGGSPSAGSRPSSGSSPGSSLSPGNSTGPKSQH